MTTAFHIYIGWDKDQPEACEAAEFSPARQNGAV
jgi:hypothetical protein